MSCVKMSRPIGSGDNKITISLKSVNLIYFYVDLMLNLFDFFF